MSALLTLLPASGDMVVVVVGANDVDGEIEWDTELSPKVDYNTGVVGGNYFDYEWSGYWRRKRWSAETTEHGPGTSHPWA